MEAERQEKNVPLISGSDQDSGGRVGAVCLSGYIIKEQQLARGNTVLLRVSAAEPCLAGQQWLDALPLLETPRPAVRN